MDLITCKFCGTNTPHSDKHYFTRIPHEEYSVEDYLLMFFKTPFVYKDPTELKTCEAYHYILYPPFTSAEHGSYQVGFVNDWIFFGGETAKKFVEQFSIPLCTPFHIENFSIIEPYIKVIEKELMHKDSCYEEHVSAFVTQMLIDLGRQYKLCEKNTHPAFAAIHEARTYMLEHMDAQISVKALAERANYSISRFCVLYREFFSATPIEDLTGARIDKAISLLCYTQSSVTEVAEQCGFSSIHYFSRKFKEKTGVSPTHYLK